MNPFVFLAMVWIACGIASGFMQFKYFQIAFPQLADECRSSDLCNAVALSLSGPINLIIAIGFWLFNNPHKVAARK